MKFLKLFLAFTLIAQSRALILNCEYSVTVWDFIGSVYQCKAKILSTLQGQSHITDATDAHLAAKNFSDVNFLYLNEQNIQTFPKGFDKFFPRLEGIYVFRTNLNVISKTDLEPFKSLKYLNLYNNQLTTLESDLFSLTRGLRYVNFGNNKIRNIGTNIVEPLKQLEQLYFHDGKMCINQYAITSEDITTLKNALTIYCPPTYEMFKVDVWNDQEFLSQIDEMTKSKLVSLTKKISQLEEKIQKQVC